MGSHQERKLRHRELHKAILISDPVPEVTTPGTRPATNLQPTADPPFSPVEELIRPPTPKDSPKLTGRHHHAPPISRPNQLLFGIACIAVVVARADGHLPLHPNDTMVIGYDCSRPTALDVYDRNSFCDLGRPAPKHGHPTATFEIAQVIWISEVEGWLCTTISTLTTHICGLWGYKKVVPSMSRQTLKKLTPAQCDMIVKRGTFKTEQGRTVSGITIPRYTTAQFNVRG